MVRPRTANVITRIGTPYRLARWPHRLTTSTEPDVAE
ncbi:Uncharacterised protein [Mycobacterium tuberculosis]|nr:Uncharacterised protein [Mycobacterium tuberculosis]CMD72780.1 Uncharacterised protein [Mycobacterium tuberculosis]CNU94016.1 Uncharacterised protein [Mycobacterium tuberculosis]CNY31840.1 Uncharacterised protein [Mycobacterium tuberculosis]CNY64808.1 Uncharacterised protein [Mycobacterium tuberculosis]